MEYNKKIFALLLERAKGERSWRSFAIDCDISYVQMRKLAFGEQENPPRRKLLEKLGANSRCGITTEDFLCAAGLCDEKQELNAKEAELVKSYAALKPRQKRALEDFAAFMLSRTDEED